MSYAAVYANPVTVSGAVVVGSPVIAAGTVGTAVLITASATGIALAVPTAGAYACYSFCKGAIRVSKKVYNKINEELDKMCEKQLQNITKKFEKLKDKSLKFYEINILMDAFSGFKETILFSKII